MIPFQKKRKIDSNKDSIFHVRGRLVDPKNIKRACTRKNLREVDASSSPGEFDACDLLLHVDEYPFIESLPPHITCRTPPSDSLHEQLPTRQSSSSHSISTTHSACNEGLSGKRNGQLNVVRDSRDPLWLTRLVIRVTIVV